MELLIVAFILIELFIAIRSFIYAGMRLESQLDEIERLRSLLKESIESKSETNFVSLAVTKREHPAINYLASCAEMEQPVSSTDFYKLLSNGVERVLSSLNNASNILPIIGLIGTFLGIVIGVLTINLQVDDIAESIQPLIDSAGLAFISSLAALFLAGLIKWYTTFATKKFYRIFDEIENLLVSGYIVNVSPKTTDDRFSRSVRQLTKSINGFVYRFDESIKSFVESFGKSYAEFIAEFKPLVEDQKKTNAETVGAMKEVAAQLVSNTEMLNRISLQQDKQIQAFGEVVIDLKNASKSLETSMELAKQHLEEFVKLGKDLKDSIQEMHKPLQDIIDNQATITKDNKDIIEEMKKLFENVNMLPTYIKAVQDYLSALNNKLDQFREVGDQIKDLKPELKIFSEHLTRILVEFVRASETFIERMMKSFNEYDREIRSLFQDIKGKDSTKLFYYHPEAIDRLNMLIDEIKSMLDVQHKYSDTLNNSTTRLVKMMEELKIWGVFRRKKQKGAPDVQQ